MYLDNWSYLQSLIRRTGVAIQLLTRYNRAMNWGDPDIEGGGEMLRELPSGDPLEYDIYKNKEYELGN